METFTTELPKSAGYYWVRKPVTHEHEQIILVLPTRPTGAGFYVQGMGVDAVTSLDAWEGYEFSRIEEPQ